MESSSDNDDSLRDELSAELIGTLEEWTRLSGKNVDSFLGQFENLSPDDGRIAGLLLDQTIIEHFTNQIKSLMVNNTLNSNKAGKESVDSIDDNNVNDYADVMRKLKLEDNQANQTEDIASPNMLIPQASIKITIKIDSKKGRGLQSTEKINFGEIIVKDDPYSHVLFSEFNDDLCTNCCRFLENSSISCQTCSLAQYCSEKCRDSDVVHAKYLCYSNLPHSSDPLTQLVLRIMIKSLVIDETYSPFCSKNATDLNQIYQSDYSSLSKLCYPPILSTELLLPSLYCALAIKEILIKSSPSYTINLSQLTQSILIHYHQLLVNKAFIVYNPGTINLSSSSYEENSEKVGLAVYPTMSLINHSCRPNVFLFFDGPKAVIRASRSIEPGEEIFLCYGPSYQQDTYIDRRLKLKEWYYFDCECNSCQNQMESPRIGYKCPQCHGPLMLNCDDTNHCLNCKAQQVAISEVREKICKALKEIEKGREAYEEGDDNKAITLLSRSYNILDNHLYRLNWKLIQSRTFLFQCLARMGHYEMAHKLCKVNVGAARDIHGLDSVDYIVSMITYLSLRCKDIDDILEEDKVKAQQHIEEVIGYVNDCVARLTQLASASNQGEDVNIIFKEEMSRLIKIKEKCLEMSTQK